MDETDQPEHDNKGGEKCRIESSEELCAEFDLPVVVTFSRPGYSLLNLLRILSECLNVGLDDDVHEGFEETEDQPAVDHLDVGSGGEVSAHTDIK